MLIEYFHRKSVMEVMVSIPILASKASCSLMNELCAILLGTNFYKESLLLTIL